MPVEPSGAPEQRVEAPIELMYRAGMETIPGIAGEVSSALQSLHISIPTLNVQTALAGEPAGMRQTQILCDDLHEALRRLTISLNNCASAVVATAADYVRTDEGAAADLRRMDPTARLDEAPQATEVTPIDNSEDRGATKVTYDDNSPTKEHEQHIEPTPPPPDVPTADENQQEHDDRIDQEERVEPR